MQLVDLADHVGADRFQRACDHALATPAGTGPCLETPGRWWWDRKTNIPW
ncbi:hypothetical protein [Mycolicibacterium peregrinum]